MRRKPVERLVAESGRGEGGRLRRSLGLWQLTMISTGATLGTGIFVVLGKAVPRAGPAVTLSFAVAGLTALFSALSYAELAGTIPVSGSSCSYAYATMGKLIAWVCGWCLVLEYGVSVSAAVPLGRLADATSIGTLFAFALVNVAVVVLRRTRPAMHRTFRVPLAPVLPALGFGFCRWMRGSPSPVTWVVFGIWMAVGLVFYFLYGFRRSRRAAPSSPAAAENRSGPKK